MTRFTRFQRLGPVQVCSRLTATLVVSVVCTLLLIIASVGVLNFGAPWLAVHAERQAVARVEMLGGRCKGPKCCGFPCIGRWATTIDLSNSRAGDADLVVLKSFRGGRVRKLVLQNTRVGDAGLAHLAFLEDLVDLDLSHTNITDAGLKVLPLHAYAELDLSHTDITDRGLLVMVLIPISRLVISGTRISKEGMEQFKQIQPTCEMIK